MTLQETLSQLNWGGAGYADYQGFGQIAGTDITQSDIGALMQDVGPSAGGTAGIVYGGQPITDPMTGSITQTIGDGSHSGVAGFDLSGFVNALGTATSSVMKTYGSISGTQVSNLGSGQYLVNGQLVNTNPIFNQGSSNLILLVGLGLVAFLLIRSMSKG